MAKTKPVKEYTVCAYVGDYPLDNQPDWGKTYPSLAEAVAAADRLWEWIPQWSRFLPKGYIERFGVDIEGQLAQGPPQRKNQRTVPMIQYYVLVQSRDGIDDADIHYARGFPHWSKV